MKKLLAVLLCVLFPVAAFAGDGGYKVGYDGGSVPGVKTGTGVKLHIEGKKASSSTLVAQNSMQCGMVPMKPMVPAQCSDLTPVCNTTTKQWGWSCVPRTQPMQCGIVPMKPMVPLGCTDLVPECNTNSGQWKWLCKK